jgi:hypothetical protein
LTARWRTGNSEEFIMKSFVPVRLLVVVAIASAGVVAAVSFAGSASAAPRTVVTCAHLNAPAPTTNTAKGALSGCTVPKATGGKGKMVADIAGGTAVITWNKTGTTSLTFTEAAASKPDEKETHGCPTHTTEIVATGSVTGGTGAAGKAIAAGSSVSAEVCVTAKGVITNEPGTKMSI